MNDVTTMLHRALDDEPPLGFAPDDLVARGRRTHRRRLFVAGTASLAVVALTVASFAVFDRDEKAGVTVAAPRSDGRPAVPNPVTEDNLARTVEQQLGIVFREVDVQPRDKMPSGEDALSLYGAVADAGGDSRFLFYSFPDGRPLPKADRSPGCGSDFTIGDGPDEQAYVGTCDVTTLPNGSVLVVKHGVTPDGYARAAAMLFRPDGSGLNVESTNQDAVDAVTCVEDATGKHCPIAPITRKDTGVPAQALGDLLVALEPATR